jgi:SAM-dependent methyltransferase
VEPEVDAEDLKARYDEWHLERSRDLGLDPGQERFFRWLFELIGDRGGQRLLDVACGSGLFLAFAAGRGMDVTGVDISTVAAERARRLVPEAEVEVAPGEALPFADETFDVVTCLGSLEHFPDPLAGVRELRRVLRPTGTALVFVPNLVFVGHLYFALRYGTQPTEGGQAFSETFRTSGGWAELFEQGGLRVRAFHPWNYIYASERVSPRTKEIWNRVARFVPRHGAYAFAFVCSKD